VGIFNSNFYKYHTFNEKMNVFLSNTEQ